MRKLVLPCMLIVCCAGSLLTAAQQKKKEAPRQLPKDTTVTIALDALSFRPLGPALMSGRVADLAFNPQNKAEYYVVAASGGVWKTSNYGTTFEPVFDSQGSYSIGCIALEPGNPNVVWVGTGEANNQRSVAYGDGVYKSEDGGKSWKNMGLNKSEHISRIVIDPQHTNVIYVAAYGPLWSSGGERGIYKSTDGGKTWRAILTVSEHTGFADLLMDPRNSNVLYAAAHQRQRKVFGFVDGGPESALYKSTDSGHTWQKLTNGLPSGDLGRLGIALAPSNPDFVYCIAEAAEGKGGFFRSTDRGASWEKRSSHATSGNYYQRIFVDPVNEQKIYSCDMMMQVSHDGGTTWKSVPSKNKHVDNHAMYIDPENTSHFFVGCDGGLYETWDNAQNWHYKQNLPITQFYKVSADNAFPFYNVFGGTQDNSSLGGPSRTINNHGISNADWYITNGGDGFESQVDPKDPNFIYAQSQYGGLVRFDKKSGEQTDIRPVEMEGEPALRWNWDAPLLVSQHSNTRIYFGANKLFRSDDRGNTWKAISGDLSRTIDRNKLPIMNKVWSIDAVAKNESTDIFGQLTTVAESKFDENLLFAGTDDGLIHVTIDGGKNWTAIDNIPGVPANTYVNQVITSLHDKNTVYATFNHHRYGDFRPYVYVSKDAGKTWTAIQHNLPERGSVYTIAEDHVNPNLLFVGTEFGVYCSLDGGVQWQPLKGGLPTIAVRDIEIQRRENDLVIATFGRGFYVLDDYAPLRSLKQADTTQAAIIFPVKDTWMFEEANPLGNWGGSKKGTMGESYFITPNPKVGAVFTCWIKNDLKTLRQKRQAAEAEQVKKGEPVNYPSADALRAEDKQPKPFYLLTIYDAQGNAIRRIKTGSSKGLQRATWDFRYTAGNLDAGDDGGSSYKVLPGEYKAGLHKFEDGVFTEMAKPVSFKAVAINWVTLPATDQKALQDFAARVNELRRVADGTYTYYQQLNERLGKIKTAIIAAPAVPLTISQQADALQKRLDSINMQFAGDGSLARRQFETLPGILDRIGTIANGLWNNSSAPTTTAQQSFEVANKQFSTVYKAVKDVDAAIKQLQQQLEQFKAPVIPGTLPEWKTMD